MHDEELFESEEALDEKMDDDELDDLDDFKGDEVEDEEI
jgi:hypothetical protein